MSSSDLLTRMRAYRIERNTRLRACTGGHVTKYPGKYVWYCDGCGCEFESEAKAIAPRHGEEEEVDRG